MTTTGKHAREGAGKAKKRLLAIAAAAMCLALTGGTLAYFTASETAHNVITSGGVDIALVEKAYVGKDDEGNDVYADFENVSGVMPGQAVSKIVTVENEGDAGAWVRIKVDMNVTFRNVPQGETPPVFADHIVIDYNRDAWTEGADGWWYYDDELKGGEPTAPLFTKVTFKDDMGNAYQNCTVEVDVSAQAVQTANNPIKDEEVGVPSVKGWPTSMASGN